MAIYKPSFRAEDPKQKTMKKIALLFIIALMATNVNAQNNITWEILYQSPGISTVSFFEGSLRQSADITSKEVAPLKKGDPIMIIEYSGFNAYYKAKYKGVDGYVSAASIETIMHPTHHKPDHLFVGMTKSELIELMGNGAKITSHTDQTGVVEMWEYAHDFVYLKEDIVISFTNF